MRLMKMAVAIDQHHGFKSFSRSQRCRLQSYTQLDYNILAHSLKHALVDANIHKSFSTPCLSINTSALLEEDPNCDSTGNVIPRIEIVSGSRIPRVHALVVEVAIAMASGADLLPVSSGLGGAYYLCTQNGDNIAVAKPIDEEPLAFNNPKGSGGRMLGQPGLKRSVRIGESGVRELAAYLLDHGGFAGVPPTALVKISHVAFHIEKNSDGNSNFATSKSAAAAVVTGHHNSPCKIASLQRFVDHDFDAGELGSSGFSVASVHRIGIFDVRLLNLDRHAGNMLVKKYEAQEQQLNYHHNYSYAAATVGVLELVPIDHGLCLPEWLDDPYFEWLHWPQASVPFSDSEMDYISKLDPYKDAQLLRSQIPALREAAIRVLVLCTIFLKRAAASGLCLADIGEMMTRQFCAGEETLSALENLCLKVKATMEKDTTTTTMDTRDDEKKANDGDENGKQVFYANLNLRAPPHRLFESYPYPAPGVGMVSRFSSAGSIAELMAEASLFPVLEENDHHKVNGGGGVLMKSASFSVSSLNSETGAISLGDMSADEWEFFLDNFENKFLPQLLELQGCTKSKCFSLKQRSGTSCKF